MSTEPKDFSMYLSNELMRLFGEPYQSSITVTRRFGRGNLRVYVDYERERDELRIEGLVADGGVTLTYNDALAFIKEIEKKVASARTYRMDLVGNDVTIFPLIEFGAPFVGAEGTIEKKTQDAANTVRKVFSDLEKVEGITGKYRKKEVGYPKLRTIWKKALKSADIGKKGRLLEQVFVRLFQLDGSFTVVGHNVRTETEEIDIVLQADTSSPFWSKVSPPILLFECKNWKNKVGTKELQVFATKIENRPKLLCRIGYLVSISGFTSDAKKELIGYRARDFVLATITADQIDEIVEKKKKISELLKERLIDAGFR